MRKLASTLLAALLVILLAACSPEEQSAVTAVNDLRHAQGLPGLAWEEGAYQKARAWSQHMADQKKISHSNLAEGVPAGWRTIGENVAVNSTVDGAMRALENSPGHRANILNPKFKKVAIGIVHAHGSYWVTQVFIG